MTPWNGRLEKHLHSQALKFSSSLSIDKRLWREDIDGSLAHVKMLAKQRIISAREARRILNSLKQIRREINAGKFSFSVPGGRSRFVAEDIHMAIENRVIERQGKPGAKLHTARSRNDQNALDERLFLRSTIRHMLHLLRRLQKTLVAKAEEYETVIMPGYTHLQRAQPVLLAHHLLAYVSMLDRDHRRMEDCLKRVNLSPLGACALAGTSFPIDRNYAAKLLHFDGIIENSIDAVSDRDVHIEFLACCAITMMHLSRFAEELVLWSSKEWSFAELADEFTTGSSIMPQKKNPDTAELVRGKTGRVYGSLVAFLTVMKALPMAYNRDMQENKELLFDAADTVASCLSILSSMVKSLRFDIERFERELESDFVVATDLADYLVRKGLPFRNAHAVVGAIVRSCLRRRISFAELSLREYKRHSRLFEKDLHTVLDVRASLARKKSSGSTSPQEVKKAIRAWKMILKRTHGREVA